MNADSEFESDDERGSEVDDYTGEVPTVEHRDPDTHAEGPQPSGFGDGDVADVDDSEFGLPNDMFDLDAVIAERDQYKDIMMRVQADFENYRKRTANKVQDDVDRATGRLAEAFLPVLDAAEAAYLRHPDEIGPLLNVMLTELKKHGLETLDLDAQPFDPQVAEAVAHEPGDSGEVMITEVMRSGYRWRGKTLRPAMVRTKD